MNLNWTHVQSDIRSAPHFSGPREALLKEIKLVCLSDLGTGAVARLSLNSKFSIQMFERLLMDDFKAAIERRLEKPVSFEFEVSSSQESFDLEAPEELPVASEATDSGQVYFREKFRLNPSMNLNLFVRTQENELARRAVELFISPEPQNFAVLTFEGASGAGKTHLLHGAGWRSKEILPNHRVKVLTGDEFITEFQMAIAKKSMADFRRRYRLETDLLLIDDLHSIARAKGTQEELFNIMNHYLSSGRRLMMTSDRAVSEIEGLEDRIKSRLLGGLVVHVPHPSPVSRREILQSKLALNGLNVEADLLDRLLAKTGPCVRSIDGVFHKLQMLSKLNALNRGAIEAIIGQSPSTARVRLEPLAILEQVAVKHGLTVEDLKSKARARRYIDARRESMTRLRNELGLSTPEIGRLHNRDHSTVLATLGKQ